MKNELVLVNPMQRIREVSDKKVIEMIIIIAEVRSIAVLVLDPVTNHQVRLENKAHEIQTYLGDSLYEIDWEKVI